MCDTWFISLYQNKIEILEKMRKNDNLLMYSKSSLLTHKV